MWPKCQGGVAVKWAMQAPRSLWFHIAMIFSNHIEYFRKSLQINKYIYMYLYYTYFLSSGKASNSTIIQSSQGRQLSSQKSQRVVETCDLPHLSLPERAKKRKSKTGHTRDLRFVCKLSAWLKILGILAHCFGYFSLIMWNVTT